VATDPEVSRAVVLLEPVVYMQTLLIWLCSNMQYRKIVTFLSLRLVSGESRLRLLLQCSVTWELLT